MLKFIITSSSFFVALFSFTVALATEDARLPDPSQRGPFAVATGQYKFKASEDKMVLTGIQTELWARVFWPKISTLQDARRTQPILFFLHGNHPTCGLIEATGPRSGQRFNRNCKYTQEGICPDGQIVTPNHEGYNYVAAHLASYGYIVVSINANRGINCNSGSEEDSGLNLARGKLVLRHIQKWHEWATRGGAPRSLNVKPNAFINKIDFENIGLMGHSRGGEGMRAAYALYRDIGSPWPKLIPGAKFTGIFEIGAVDGQTNRVLDAEDTAWNQLLPMCDGDVTDLQGRLPFERMILRGRESTASPKSLYMVWGTNHNFYNSEWQQSDSRSCSGHDPIFGSGPVSLEQQQIARTSMSAFFLSHVGRNHFENLGNLFDPQYPLPSYAQGLTRIDRDFVSSVNGSKSLILDDFDQPTGVSSRRVANVARGITVTHQTGYQPNRASITWREPGEPGTQIIDRYLQLNGSEIGQGHDLTQLESLNFRLARQVYHSGSKLPTSFHVALVDENDQVSASVSLNQYIDFLGPASDTQIFQTVRIPVRDFRLSAGQRVRGVRLIFDESNEGEIYLANVRFSLLRPQLPDNLTTREQKPSDFSKFVLPQPLEIPEAVSVAQVVATKSLGAPRPSFEIQVKSETLFLAENELPILFLAGNRFSLSRFANSEKLDSLIFTIPAEAAVQLPETGTMKVQYGSGRHAKAWLLPNYDKSKLF